MLNSHRLLPNYFPRVNESLLCRVASDLPFILYPTSLLDPLIETEAT